MCCGHFDDLVSAMFELREAVRERQHQDFVAIYEGRTYKNALAEGAKCESILPHVVPKKKDTEK